MYSREKEFCIVFFLLLSFVVDMRKGTYRQKCHDLDCKDFQGKERTLPKRVTPWLMMLDEEWGDDDQSQS